LGSIFVGSDISRKKPYLKEIISMAGGGVYKYAHREIKNIVR
jgi:hypothetical protein